MRFLRWTIFVGRRTGADARDYVSRKNLQAFNKVLEIKNLCLYGERQSRPAAKKAECGASAIP